MLKSTMKSLCWIGGAVVLACAWSNRFEIALFGADNPPATSESLQFFKDKIRPILTQNCYACHTDTAMGAMGPSSALAISARMACCWRTREPTLCSMYRVSISCTGLP